jgi:sporulation protein YlmC with PRC-barrel domain
MSERYLKLESLIGKEVIDTNASKLGSAKEIAYDLDQRSFVLVIDKEDQTNLYISSQSIEKIKDVIIVKAE